MSPRTGSAPYDCAGRSVPKPDPKPSTATPVCCYCDADLSCARCGHEQPYDDISILKVRIEELKSALQFIADGYENHNVNHVDYRVKVYQVALDALQPKSKP